MPLSLQLLNIRGLLACGGKAGFVADLAVGHRTVVSMLTETWLSDSVLSSEVTVNIPDYSLFRCDRKVRQGGGVAVLVRDNLSGELLSSFDNGVVQLVIVKVHALNTIFCVMYRPPDTKLAEFTPALAELDQLLSDLPAPTPTVVLGGDFNFPATAIDWHRVDGVLVPAVHEHREVGDGDVGPRVRIQAAKLIELTHRHQMAQQVDQITHGKEVLDLIFTNNHELPHSVVTDSFPLFTDHRVVTMGANYKLSKSPPTKQMHLLDSARRLKCLDFPKAPWDSIRKELTKVDWSPMESLAKSSPTVAHSFLLSKIIPIMELLVPMKKVGGKRRSKQTRQKDLLWRKLKKVKDQLMTTTSHLKMVSLLQTRQELESELKAMYSNHTMQAEDRVIKEMKENPNIFFRYAQARQKTRAKVGPLLDPESGTLNQDPAFTTEVLSDQYSSVFTQPRAEWDIADIEQFFSVDTSKPTGHILTNLDFTSDHVEYACAELKVNSATGPDGVPASLLKECRKELKQPLWLLWKESMKQGVIPPDLLLVLICPVHKGGSRADPSQYRPVALTSHIMKVFERVIRRALVTYLEQSGALPDGQHGFREQRSTLTQLMSHWDQVLDLLEQGQAVDVIYTDFAKAFDKCETNVLLHTLRDCGVKGEVGKWIAAFLDPTTRQQAVGVDGTISELSPVVSGVPQGTVLGPVLFLVHILGLCSSLSPGTSSSSFADDTRIWRGVSNIADCSKLQDDLQSVYASTDHINMTFNSGKFEWLRYSAGPSSPPDFQYLAPDSSAISQKPDLKDLGVRMSSDLTFTLQIEKVVTTASQMAGWGLRTFRSRGRHLMMVLLKSLVQPHLDYCSQLWSPCSQGLINKLEDVQKSLVMKMWGKSLNGLNYWGKLQHLRLYSQERRRERYQIIFIWKISQGLVSGYHIPFNQNSRTGRWAVPAQLPRQGVPSTVKVAKESSLRVKGCQLFNLLPPVLRNANHGDTIMFKNNLDHYLSCVPDQPTTQGLARAAQTNSLLHQVPLIGGWN